MSEEITEKPQVLGHPDDAAEEWLAGEYENADDASVGYDRGEMIDAFHAGSDWAREQIAKFGKDADGRWITLEPKPVPELPARAAYEAFLPGGPIDWEHADADVCAMWGRAAQAAIDAATEGSIRACGYALADIGRFLEAEAAAPKAGPVTAPDRPGTPEVAPEFPPCDQVNWNLLRELEDRPHPLVNNEWQTTAEGSERLNQIESFHRMRNVHHLLDFAGVPHGYSLDTRDIDNRTLLAIIAMGNLRERLARISAWHARETGPAGTVGDFCTECGHSWPCESRRMADGTYTEEET